MNKDILVIIEHIHGQVADISYVMLAAGRFLADTTGGALVALLLGHEQQTLANDLAADQVLYGEHPHLAHFSPDVYLDALAGLIAQANPRAVLCGHTAIGMDLAAGLSVRLDLPLVTQCREFNITDYELCFVSQLCGGKIMAEGPLPEPATLLTLVTGGYQPDQGRADQPPAVIRQDVPLPAGTHFRFRGYIEPEAGDVDISRSELLIAVGRGLQNQDDLELVEELAAALGGAVCASRPIIDQGWLPISRLVGKSGRRVKPKLYLALGISGAPEHVEGITGSGTIIAINTDPDAPIFNIARYGAEVDMLDLVEALCEELQDVVMV